MTEDWPDPNTQTDDLSDRGIAYGMVAMVVAGAGLWLFYLGEHVLAVGTLGLLTALMIAADAFSGS